MEEDRIVHKGVSVAGKIYTQDQSTELNEVLTTKAVERLKGLGVISGDGWSGGEEPPALPEKLQKVAARGFLLLNSLTEEDLRGIVGHLEARVAEYNNLKEEVVVAPHVEATVKVEDAVETVETSTPLPIGFPARHLLVKAGFDTVEKLYVAPDADIQAIKGVGAAMVAQIREALA